MAKRLCTNDMLEMLELEDDGEEIFCEGSDEEFCYDEELENDRSESDNKHGDEDDTVLEEFVIDNYMVNDVDDDYNMEDSNRDCVMKNANGGSEIEGDRQQIVIKEMKWITKWKMRVMVYINTTWNAMRIHKKEGIKENKAVRINNN